MCSGSQSTCECLQPLEASPSRKHLCCPGAWPALFCPLTPAFSALTGGDTSLWCPSLQEISATFHSLGAHSPSLQPLGPTQHAGR